MTQHHPTPLRVAAIAASWHRELVDRAVNGFTEALGAEHQVQRHDVPGAFEIPLVASRLATSGQVDAIVAFGLVVDGGIYRHEFVAQAVVEGLMRVQLDAGVPVFSVVLTPHHFHEHQAHDGFFHEHLVTKGAEAAGAVLQTLALHQQLSAPPVRA